MPFGMLFQSKNVPFPRSTVNKHFAINVILTELKKPGCNTFHSYKADIDITKVSVQNPLKYFITEISEKKDLVVLFLYHAIQNQCTLKVTKSKTRYLFIIFFVIKNFMT